MPVAPMFRLQEQSQITIPKGPDYNVPNNFDKIFEKELDEASRVVVKNELEDSFLRKLELTTFYL